MNLAKDSQNRVAIARLVMREAGRRASTTLRKQRLAVNWARPAIPTHLVALAPDRRRPDPSSGKHVLAGVFSLGGLYYDLGVTDPFTAMGESEVGAELLHSFRWLRHLACLQNDVASQTALDLVNIWIDGFGNKLGASSYAPITIAQRMTAWFQNAGTILQNADITFERKFIRTLVEDLQTLRSEVGTMPASMDRLHARIAIANACLALDLSLTRRNAAFTRLVDDCNQQILPDGGHISRNPEELIALMIGLAAFVENCSTLGVAPPTQLIHTMDRIVPTLSMFIHADGELAGFNGVAYVAPDDLALALRIHETIKRPTLHAPQSGYERMAIGRTTIIADVGNPPPMEISQSAHAGTLAFEMSSGRHRYIVNAGVDRFGPAEYRDISRQTAAHSTATINGQSSSIFSNSDRLTQWLGTSLTIGPSKSRSERNDTETSQSFRAAHNGYVSRFGLIHERLMSLSDEGNLIEGTDRLFTPSGKMTTKEGLDVTIRFHLHPAIHPILDGEGNIMLTADRDDSWVFECPEATAEIIQSVYFSDLGGLRKTQSIAIKMDPSRTPELSWSLRRTGLGKWSR